MNLPNSSRLFIGGYENKRQKDPTTSVEDMKFDWITQKLYWTTGKTGRVYSTDFDTKHIVNIAAGDWTYALALEPCKGYIFWSDSGYKPTGGLYDPRIERANMGGGNRTRIVTMDVSLPVSLTIDYTEARLYWADINKLTVERCDFFGNYRETIVAGQRIKSLDIYGEWLYYVDPTARKLSRFC